MIKRSDRTYLVVESVNFTYMSQSQPREARAGTQVRNLEAGAEAKAMEGAIYWLVPHGLLNGLSYTTQAHR